MQLQSRLVSKLQGTLSKEFSLFQEVITYRSRFPKPVWRYKVLAFFGRNIVASEGEEWKKYRKISAPAFSDVSPRSLNNSLYVLVPSEE